MGQDSVSDRFLPKPLLGILVAAIPIVVVCYFVSHLRDRPPRPEEMTAQAVAERLQPVAHVLLASIRADATTAAPAKGQAVYDGLCSGCHGPGVAGAPKVGDRAAWKARIAQGFDVLVLHAISGFTGKSGVMPPRGGGSNDDTEIARAVAYMAGQSGAKFAEPAHYPVK